MDIKFLVDALRDWAGTIAGADIEEYDYLWRAVGLTPTVEGGRIVIVIDGQTRVAITAYESPRNEL